MVSVYFWDVGVHLPKATTFYIKKFGWIQSKRAFTPTGKVPDLYYVMVIRESWGCNGVKQWLLTTLKGHTHSNRFLSKGCQGNDSLNHICERHLIETLKQQEDTEILQNVLHEPKLWKILWLWLLCMEYVRQPEKIIHIIKFGHFLLYVVLEVRGEGTDHYRAHLELKVFLNQGF